MAVETLYEDYPYKPSEMDHKYGSNVHLLADPFALTLLARLCSHKTEQPAFNRAIALLYRQLLTSVVNAEFPRKLVEVPTRMADSTPRGRFRGSVVDPSTPVVTVDIARAGILPSQICYDMLNELMDSRCVRQDHLIVSRATDVEDRVEGATISGKKIGGSVENRMVLFPDPMGATGSSLATAMRFYKDHHGGHAKKWVTLNLIVTPEFIRRIQDEHPDAVIYALRLDRGMSDAEILKSPAGSNWSHEVGLDEKDYIVPGGGGFGELMNNSWI